MIADLYLNPLYWLSLGLIVAASAVLTRSRVLSFPFVLIVFAAQYVCHAFAAFGATSDISWFTIAFLLALIVGLAPQLVRHPVRWLREGDRTRSVRFPAPAIRSFVRGEEGTWILVSKLYLMVFGIVRLSTYPWLGGELDLVARLEASTDNRWGFLLGLAVVPPIAAVATQWLRRGYRLGVIDYLVCGLAGAAILVSGSKATLLPALLAVVGAAYLTAHPLRRRRFFWILGCIGAAITVGGYWISVAASGFVGALGQLAYRIAANTDSLEYLAALGVHPSDFPFAGIGALAPTLLKALGGTYDYSPGVWLHGERFGQWQGFGPNPGLVLDYFGNLSWIGVIAGAGIGLLCWTSTRVGGAVGASFAATCYLAVVDITLFEAAFGVWFVVLICIAGTAIAARRFRVIGNALSRARGLWHHTPKWVRGDLGPTPTLHADAA